MSEWESWTGDVVCTNCKNWNVEYRKKTACHTCKDTRIHGTKSHSGNGTNSSGFFGFPGGFRNGSGAFYSKGIFSDWWSASDYNTGNAYYYYLFNHNDDLTSLNEAKERGFSVRCLRD
jgi:uncharacterized protein (TIGR02145 family)